ncbi:hypothetical protein TNCV_861481 [Trichonephila clavipes]|nr:hypothetical protein TNCV_861481 [Trichonephila clavipes]
MDMSAPRTDVAPSIEVSDLFTLEPLCFDVMAATDYIDNCTTCTESEDLCGILDEILYTLEDVDAEVANTPERLRLVNLVQWAALKCSRRSIRLQNAEFKKYIREVELSKRVPTAASPASQQKRQQAKREPASPQKDVPSKKQKSERKLPRTSTSPRHIEDVASSILAAMFPMYHVSIFSPDKRSKPQKGRSTTQLEEGESSAEESSDEINSAKPAKPVIAPSSPAAKVAESASAPESNQKDDGFTTVGRN